jgi:hypothetical protein
MTTKGGIKKLHTTAIGELITAIMDAAKTITSDERRAYKCHRFCCEPDVAACAGNGG